MNLLFSTVWRKKVWRMNRSAKGLLIVTTNLDGFSLVNHRYLPNSPNFLPAKLYCYIQYVIFEGHKFYRFCNDFIICEILLLCQDTLHRKDKSEFQKIQLTFQVVINEI